MIRCHGMHRYNNQDHSMYAAMLTVETLFGASHEIWDVNVEEVYHEADGSNGTSTRGTGCDAPILPTSSGPRT